MDIYDFVYSFVSDHSSRHESAVNILLYSIEEFLLCQYIISQKK